MPVIPLPEDISSVTGPLFTGIVLNSWLYGILTVQVYVYYHWYPGDKKCQKLLVYFLFLLETLQVSLSIFDGFRWFVLGYGNLSSFVTAGATGFEGPILNSLISFVVQTFFCWQIWRLGESWLPPSLIFILALTSVAGGMASGIQTMMLDNMLEVNSTLFASPSVWLSSAALTDTAIAGAMTYLLWRARSQYRQTNDILSRIICLTVESGSLSAGVAIITLVVFLAFPKRPFFACPGIAHGKLYSNTLLVIFNNRTYMARTGATLGDEVKCNIYVPREIIKSIPSKTSGGVQNVSLKHSQQVEVETAVSTKLDYIGADNVNGSLEKEIATVG